MHKVVLTPQPSAKVKTGSLLVAERAGIRPRFITLLLHTELITSIETYERRKISHERSGGSADSNFFYRPGVVIVDGLGPVGGNMHRNDEFIDLPTIGTRARAVAELLNRLGLRE